MIGGDGHEFGQWSKTIWAMLPRWSLTDPSGRPLLADCLRSNPSKARRSSQVRYIIKIFNSIVLLRSPSKEQSHFSNSVSLLKSVSDLSHIIFTT